MFGQDPISARSLRVLRDSVPNTPFLPDANGVFTLLLLAGDDVQVEQGGSSFDLYGVRLGDELSE